MSEPDGNEPAMINGINGFNGINGINGGAATDTIQPPFQRLHPLSILLKSLASLGQNLIAIGVLHFSVFDGNFIYSGLAALGLIGLVVGITALVWSRFTYQIAPKEIRIKSGLLNRNNRSIPFDRIQDVSLEQKPLGRLLGLATVKLETGSGGGEDGKLEALALQDARMFRDRIRDYKAGLLDKADLEPAEASEDRPPLFAMDNRRILIAGLFNFSFILLAILGTIAQNLDFLLPGEFFDPRYWIEQISGQEAINGLSTAARIAGIIAAIGSLILVGIVSGIIRTYIREYGFRLDHVQTGQPGFRRRRGLFTLTDMVMPIHRVQAAIIRTGPIREHFGWHHLKLQSLAGDPSGQTDHSAAPCASAAEIAPVLKKSAISQPPGDLRFQDVDAAFWWRSAALFIVSLTTGALIAGSQVHPGFYALTLLAVPAVLLMILNWRRHEFALTETQLFVRKGWWRRKFTILPLRKVQTVDVSQSPLDHPLGLANITVGVAGGSAIAPLKIMAIPFEAAMELRRTLIGG